MKHRSTVLMLAASIALLFTGLLLPQEGGATGPCLTGEAFKSGSTFINVTDVPLEQKDILHKPGTVCVRFYRSNHGYDIHVKRKKAWEECPSSLRHYYEYVEGGVAEQVIKLMESKGFCSSYRLISQESREPASGFDGAALASAQAGGDYVWTKHTPGRTGRRA